MNGEGVDQGRDMTDTARVSTSQIYSAETVEATLDTISTSSITDPALVSRAVSIRQDELPMRGASSVVQEASGPAWTAPKHTMCDPLSTTSRNIECN